MMKNSEVYWAKVKLENDESMLTCKFNEARSEILDLPWGIRHLANWWAEYNIKKLQRTIEEYRKSLDKKEKILTASAVKNELGA